MGALPDDGASDSELDHHPQRSKSHGNHYQCQTTLGMAVSSGLSKMKDVTGAEMRARQVRDELCVSQLRGR